MGKPMLVEAGTSLNLTFNENPSTGYTWSSSVIPPYVTITKGSYVPGKCANGAVGCPGTITFRVTFSNATPVGTSIEVDFYYTRSFDRTTDMVPTQSYRFTIV